jgi:general secretion pathway protein K
MFYKTSKLIQNQKGFSLIFSILVISTMLALVTAVGIRLHIHRNYFDETIYLNYHINNFSNGLNISLKLLKEDIQTVDSFNDIWAFQLPPITIDDRSKIILTITPEDSKFNLNNLIWGDDRINNRLKTQLDDLFFYLGFHDLHSDVILDWVDEDDMPLPSGAESDYYLNNYGYHAKNNFFSSLEEIFLMKNFRDIENHDDLLKDITIYGADNRVNINTASETVIASVSDRIDEQMLFEIIKLRNDYAIQNLDDLLVIPFISQELINFLKSAFKSTNSIFKIDITSIIDNRHSKNSYFIVKRIGSNFKILHTALEPVRFSPY